MEQKRLKKLVSSVIVGLMLVGCDRSSEQDSRGRIERLEVSPPVMQLTVGEQEALQAIAYYSDGTSSNVTKIVNWVSEDSLIADVDLMGNVKGLYPGETDVNAFIDTISGSSTVVQVNNENDLLFVEPVAYEQVTVTKPFGEVSGQLFGKDYTDQSITFLVEQEPEFGTLTVDSDSGEFVYRNASTSDHDSFSYFVQNSKKSSAPTMVQIGISDYELNQIKGGVNDGSKMNFVFVADGFTDDDMHLFHEFSASTTEYFFSYGDAMINQKDAWNVYTLATVSNQSGVSYEDASPESGGTKVDNLFGSQFWCRGIQRLMCIDDMGEVVDYVSQAVPNWDNIILVSNSLTDGGAGYMNARFGTSTISSSAAKVAIHEMGHGFFNLDDEYFYKPYEEAPPTEINRANVTIESDPELVKWNKWIGEPTSDGNVVGLYEGGAVNIPYGVWRPTKTSIMEYLGEDFEPVNRQAWLLKVYEHAGILTDIYPRSKLVNVDQNQNKLFFEVKPLIASNVGIQWFVDGVHHYEQDGELIFGLDIDETTSEISAVVTDKTGWIRHDPFGFSHETIHWNLCRELEECQ